MAEFSVACLVKIKNGEQVRAHIITRPQFVIGRSADADLPYVSSTVSRQHLRVELGKDSVTVTDLKSNNGTFIDGVLLQAERPIIVQGNNIIRLGASKDEFTFQIIPLPMELMNAEEQKATLLKNMSHVKEEAEKLGRKALEEERKAFHAQLTLEKEQIKLAFDQELEERRKNIEAQCREILESAKSKADEILTRSKQEADTYRAESIKADLEKKRELEAKISKLQEEARTITEKTRAQAEADAQEIIHQAKEEAKRETREARQKSESLNQETQRLRRHAESEAEKILNAARAEARKEMEAALRNSESISKEAQVKASERLKSAEKESTLLIERATGQIEKAKKEAELTAKNKLEEARTKAEKLLSETKSRIDAEVAEQKRQALDSVRTETLQEQEKIIKEYRGSIERLSQTKQELEIQLKQIKSDTDSYKNEYDVLNKQIEQLKTAVLEERHMLTEIQDQLEEAQKIIAKGEKAAEEMQKAKEQRDQMKAQFEKYQSGYNQGMRKIEDELKASKEKSVLEFQEFKKNQDAEMAKAKLEAMERLKQTIQDEEVRYRQTLEMRAVEISRAIESKLLPKLESHIKAKGLSASLGGVLDHIQHAVNEVVLKDKPAIKAVTEHLGVDPEKEKAKKARRKNWAVSTIAAGLAALAIFGEPIYEYLKANRGKYTEYLISKRSAESIYTPLQTDDWKSTYSGNVLYLRHYFEAKTDEIYEKEWALRLNDLELLRSMKLSEDDIIKFIGKEAALVRQLMELREAIDARYLDEGLGKMNQVEFQTISEMREILKGEANLEAIRGIERDFTLQFIRKRYGKNSLRLPSDSQ